MNAFLGLTREQAILAAIVQEAHNMIEQKGSGFLGRTAMQKIPYFLKVCSIPLRYRFDVYHYGTFCQPILSDIEALELERIIYDGSTNPDRYSAYTPGKEMEEFLRKHQSAVKPHLSTIQKVVNALYPWNPARLELISTLHYVNRQLEAMGDCPTRDEVMERFQSFKGDKFPRPQVEETLEQMAATGLVCLSD